MTKLTLPQVEDLLKDNLDLGENLEDVMTFLKTPMCQEFFDYVYEDTCENTPREIGKLARVKSTLVALGMLHKYFVSSKHGYVLYRASRQMVFNYTPSVTLDKLERSLYTCEVYLEELDKIKETK